MIKIENTDLDTSKSNIPSKSVRKKHILNSEIKAERAAYKSALVSDVDLVFGLDNGSTGTISSWNLKTNKIYFQETPSVRTLNYQQRITYIDRINYIELKKWFETILEETKLSYNKNNIKVLVVMERPMVNPQRFDASLKAVRAFEACVIILEQLNLNYIVIDSKKWQHYFFGKNTLFLDLKKSSQAYGNKVFEEYKDYNTDTIENMIKINKLHGDADALLITKYTIDKLLKNSKKEDRK